jgi:hypothetical protein
MDGTGVSCQAEYTRLRKTSITYFLSSVTSKPKRKNDMNVKWGLLKRGTTGGERKERVMGGINIIKGNRMHV